MKEQLGCKRTLSGLTDRREFLASVAGIAAASLVGTRKSSAAVSEAQRNVSRSVEKRLLFPFSAALPPRAEHLFPGDGWLSDLKEAGYTHVFLQSDPFAHPEMNLGDMNENDYRHLSFFDMAHGPRSQGYRSWLTALCETLRRHGLNLGMELWEPRLSLHASQMLPDDWKGPVLEQAVVTGGRQGYQPLCLSNPAARAWFLTGVKIVLEAAPQMDTILWGIYDNEAYICDDKCPRCAPKPEPVRLGELYVDVLETARKVQPQFELTTYNWNWLDDRYYNEVFQRLPRGTKVVTRLEKGATFVPDPAHPEWSGEVFDQSLACDELGNDFQRCERLKSDYGAKIVAIPTLSGPFESWQMPHVPAIGHLLRKFDLMRKNGVLGWVDFDCGAIHRGLMLEMVTVVQHHPEANVIEWKELLASRRYGDSKASKLAIQAWDAFDEAVRYFPQNIVVNGIPGWNETFGVAVALLPMHPFLPERAKRHLDGTYHEVYWADPHNFIAPAALPPVRAMMARTRGLALEGTRQYRELVGIVHPEFKERAELDATLADLVLLGWQSTVNFYEWAAAMQGDRTVELAQILESEIELTARFKAYLNRPELEIGNMVWSWPRAITVCVPEAGNDIYSCARLNGCNPSPLYMELRGDFCAWKIAHLKDQIRMLTA